jgi:hypothetical protein
VATSVFVRKISLNSDAKDLSLGCEIGQIKIEIGVTYKSEHIHNNNLPIKEQRNASKGATPISLGYKERTVAGGVLRAQ